MSRSMLLLLVLFWSLPAFAQDSHLYRFVDEQTLAVGRVDVRRFDSAAFFQSLGKMLSPIAESIKGLEEKTAGIKEQLLKAGVTEIYFVYGINEFNKMPVLYAALADKSKAELVASLLTTGQPGPFQKRNTWLSSSHEAGWKYIDGYVVVGQTIAVEAKVKVKSVSRPELQTAQTNAPASGFSMYLAPTADMRRVIEELVPNLPPELGGGPSTVFTQGLQWAAINMEFPPKLSFNLTIQAASAELAQQIAKQWKAILAEMKREIDKPVHTSEAFKHLYQLLTSLKVNVQDRQLSVTSDVTRITELTTLLGQSFTSKAGDDLNAGNLRTLLIAIHNYHNDYARLPNQAILSKDEKPLLSWRVAMLPYLGEDQLYKQFKLNEPWDSEHNKKLIEKMPKIYSHPFARNVPASHTLYQVFYSKQGTKPAAFIMETGKITLGQVTMQDGTSNTFLVTDAAAQAVPWTKPADLLYDGTIANLPKLVSPRGDGWAHVCFGDGSVRRFKPGGSPKLLWQLIGRNDGASEDVSEILGDR